VTNAALADRKLQDLIERAETTFRQLDGALLCDDDLPEDTYCAIDDALPTLDALIEFLIDLREGQYRGKHT
jgi:hypothetical protein